MNEKMEEEEETCNFEDMGLDDRILKAIAKLGWKKPTLIQEKAISLALEGKDILARARTGSGKTGSYVVPIIHKILKIKQRASEQCTKALILAPTRELCSQAQRNIIEMTSCCSRDVKSVDVSTQQPLSVQKPLLTEKPDIVVGTPSRILGHLSEGNLHLKPGLEMVVIDEADLLFSFGYEKDMKELLTHLPESYQAFLMSATLSDDIKALKSMMLHNPVTLKLEEPQLPTIEKLKQFKLRCEEEDKFLTMYALLKCHIVNQFNEGRYEIIIAADETSLENPSNRANNNKNKRFRRRDYESGISRGIDFRNVTTIINFDFPQSVESYIHRVGRTARADARGMSLSLVCMKETARLEEVEKFLLDSYPQGLTEFKFDMEEASGLRYRSETARRSVTKDAIREARRKEIKVEMLNSQKLKTYFEDNPRDLQVLKHDKVLHVVKVQPHLKNVPDYLVPQSLKNTAKYYPMRKSHTLANGKRAFKSRGQARYQKQQADPLKSFSFEPKKKKRRTK
ncbi:hypothetical protein HELRODRAFT_189737 [Helobdella robusta]|uniref:RNA helicase n=1 Tax=Helobdella robusta TaxID=6412 RepID=T1FRB5_HELRO|nr:hypothetical protein HELRODRAFT_189737 [Helobdella robusta]ESN91607.1 hypothetical protein HELRODRAFT_189737 [Helobdella robusta]